MKFLTKLTNPFFTLMPLDRLHTLILIYYIVEISLFNPRNAIYKIPFLFVSLSLFLLKQHKSFPKIFWGSIFMSLAVDVIIDFTLIHNHLTLFLYILAAIFMAQFIPIKERATFLNQQFILFFGIAMIFAGIHKLISKEFMDGSLLSYYFVRGALGGYLMELIPSFKEAIEFNKLQANEFSYIDPLKTDFLLFNPVSNSINSLFKYTSWAVALLEIIVGILALLIPRKRIFYFITYLLIIGILITRYETGFLALLVISILFIIPEKFNSLKIFSFFLFVLCICLIVYDVGFA